MTNHGVKVSVPQKRPEAGIVKAEERLVTQSTIVNVDPRVAIQEGNIPFHCGSKLRVVSGFGPAQSAIRHEEV